jgi:hypothetical protein
VPGRSVDWVTARERRLVCAWVTCTTAAHGQTWLFDPARPKWEQLSPPTSPSPRDLHSMVFDEVNGVVILHGGRPADRQTALIAWGSVSRTTTAGRS